jgi:hypothetical protein
MLDASKLINAANLKVLTSPHRPKSVKITTTKPLTGTQVVRGGSEPGYFYAPYIPLHTTPIIRSTPYDTHIDYGLMHTIRTKIYQLKIRPEIKYIKDPYVLRPEFITKSEYMCISIRYRSCLIIFCPSVRRMWMKYKGARLKPVSYDAKIAKAISMSFISP